MTIRAEIGNVADADWYGHARRDQSAILDNALAVQVLATGATGAALTPAQADAGCRRVRLTAIGADHLVAIGTAPDASLLAATPASSAGMLVTAGTSIERPIAQGQAIAVAAA